ncbi:hypothetical protein VFC2061_29060 [Listeria monocytogenes]
MMNKSEYGAVLLNEEENVSIMLKDCSLKTREERVQLGNFVSFFG